MIETAILVLSQHDLIGKRQRGRFIDDREMVGADTWTSRCLIAALFAGVQETDA